MKTFLITAPSGRHHVFRRGRAENLAEDIDGKTIAAVLTDPPYCSGGSQSASRKRGTSEKYIRSSGSKYKDFPGDTKDQRSWTRWVSQWLGDLWQVSHNETYCMVFVDWRQIAALTDAVQMANWTWRGVAVWDKTEGSRMPHKAYFRHQAEYVVWGTCGSLKSRRDGPACPGVLRRAIDSKKVHCTQKPVKVLSWLLTILHDKPGIVVDPFAGSGSTLLAAEQNDRSSICSELDEEIAEIALDRLRAEGYRVEESSSALQAI